MPTTTLSSQITTTVRQLCPNSAIPDAESTNHTNTLQQSHKNTSTSLLALAALAAAGVTAANGQIIINADHTRRLLSTTGNLSAFGSSDSTNARVGTVNSPVQQSRLLIVFDTGLGVNATLITAFETATSFNMTFS